MSDSKSRWPVEVSGRPMKRRSYTDEVWRYAGWFISACFVSCVAKGLVLFGSFAVTAALFKSELPTTTHESVILRPSPLGWFVPCLFISILAGPLVDIPYRLLLGRERYREFSDYCSWKCGFDGTKAWCSLVAVTAPIGLIAAVLLLSSSWVIGPTGIRIRATWGFSERSYAWSEVAGVAIDDIQRNPVSGETRQKKHSTVSVIFRDGTSDRLPSSDGNCGTRNEQFASWIAESAGLKLQHVARHAEAVTAIPFPKAHAHKRDDLHDGPYFASAAFHLGIRVGNVVSRLHC